MRPIFCGNFEFDARPSDLERLFRRYGKVERVDMKSGYAFIYMEDERDAGYAIRALDRTEFGRKGRRLRVEWTKHERGGRKEVSSKRSANVKPSKTLFVINFPHHTKTRDLERHFDPYGKILNVRIRRNFAFVQYESQADATKALDATNMSKMLDRIISVEYAAREDDDRRNGYNLDRRGRDRTPDRRRRSPSPYRRERGSPDYGTGSSPAAYGRERGSPVYGRGSSHSPRRMDRSSPEYGQVQSPSVRRRERVDRSSQEYGQVQSPIVRRREGVDRSSPEYGQVQSPGRRERVDRSSPEYGQVQSPSVLRRERVDRNSPEYGQVQSPSERRRERVDRSSPEYGQVQSPSAHRREREDRSSPEYGQVQSPSARHRERMSPVYRDRSRSPRGVERNGNGYGHHPSTSPGLKDGPSPDDARETRNSGEMPELREAGEFEESPVDDRYRSQTPLACE